MSEPFEYPQAKPEIQIHFHYTPWRHFVQECKMNVLRLDMDDVSEASFRHICGDMVHTRDYQRDDDGFRSFPTIHAKSTVWLRFRINNVETTSFWNTHFQESINKQSDMGLDAQAEWRKANKNGHGEEPCCAVLAFLSGRDDYMDFNKEEEEE